MTSQPLRLAAYIRVSRTMGREGPGFMAPEQQRAAIQAYATAHGHTIEREAEDLDVSGSRRDRPGLDSLLAAVRSGEVEGIIVARMDRLSRLGIVDAMGLVQTIHDDGGAVVAVDLGMDPSTATGEMMWTFFLALARYQWRGLAESWEDAKSRALDRGAKIGPTPFGYRRREDGTLEPHPARADYVREAFRLAGRRGIPAVVEYLDGLGLVHEDGKRAGQPLRWTAYTVRRLLANRSYLGEQHYADTVHAGTHEPLATRAAFEAAQHEPEGRRQPPADFPLSGIASCSTCGGPMVGGRGGKSLRTYRCANSLAHARRRGRSCPAPATMVADRLEDHIDGVLRAWASDHGSDVLSEPGEGPDVDAALAEAEDADAEVAAYVEHTPARVPGYAEGLARREGVAVAAWVAYREAAAADTRRDRVVTGLQRLDEEPETWGQLVRDVVEAVKVKRGRGPVEGRVRVVLRDGAAPELPPMPDDAGAPVGELPELTDADAPEAA
jgi:DNA invertase Pin-like site-specific DNA recombinase